MTQAVAIHTAASAMGPMQLSTLLQPPLPPSACVHSHSHSHPRPPPLLLDPGALEQSLADYGAVLQYEPSNIDALYYRGCVYEKLGQLDEAIADFTGVLRLDPNHIKASYARGACRNLKGEFSQAIGEQQEGQLLHSRSRLAAGERAVAAVRGR